jgi:hypothetical protein
LTLTPPLSLVAGFVYLAAKLKVNPKPHEISPPLWYFNHIGNPAFYIQLSKTE